MAASEKNPEAIFYKAIEIQDPAQRAAYLDEACRGDDELHARVGALLKAHERAGDFLAAPPAGSAVTVDNPTRIEGPGTTIGRYELLELIGEGGMGLVYLAEQKEPVRRRVALKIIKPGMDSRQVVARFEAERQALALLDHPNIAHVFDAGTTEAGRPYFVMEYVKGLSITRYCDDNRLTIEQRLRLFEQVCEAVHHAHTKGIIHRDLKPSNILVSVHGERAVPKIIDFGIAKAITTPLTDKTFVTFQGQLLGTPEYMSPEQVDLATQDIDTRSDIYSLGVVLYELLAGVLPFDRESLQKVGLAELQHTLRELEPASPSIRLANMGQQAQAIADSRMTQVVPLARRLHRELEWIPLKAMRKDRCRRYKSASDMADDIQSYLNGNPLSAGPETAMYRVQKFVHKHAGSVAMVALLGVAIVLGLVASILLACRAERARQQEAAARQQVEQALVRAEKAERIAQEQRKVAEERAEKHRRLWYVHSIALADVAYRDLNIGRIRKLLDACPEDLRAWEWDHLNYISDTSSKTIRSQDGGLLTISPDLKRVVTSGSDDNTIKVWDAAMSAELMILRGHEDKVGPVRFSPDGKRIASISRDDSIRIWDMATGDELTILQDETLVTRVAFSPDGKHLVSGNWANMVKLWDLVTGTKIKTFYGHDKPILSVSFSPDGTRIISSSADGTIRVWDAVTGAEEMTLRGHSGYIRSATYSPDGTRIVCANEDKTVKVWDAATGAELMTLRGHDGMVESVAFSPDGAQIITGGESGAIKIWDAASGTELTTLLGHFRRVTGVSFSPDGRRIVSSSYDGTVKIWELEHDPTAPLTLKGRHDSMAFSPDGKQVVTGSGGEDKTIQVWNTVTGNEAMRINHPGGHVAFSPDAKRIISADGNDIHVWDASSAKKLMTLAGHEDTIWSMSYSPDGTRIASGSEDKTIRMWDAATGTVVMTLRGHGDWPDDPSFSLICSVAFSPDGKQLVSSSYDGTVKIWNVKTGGEVTTLRQSYLVSDAAFSPNGRQIVSTYGGTIRVWDAATGSDLMTLEGHDKEIMSVAFSPDGKRIVSGSKDETIRIWDTETGLEITALTIGGKIKGVSFSPDGKTIATVSEIAGTSGCTVTLWKSAAPANGEGPR